MHLDVTDLRQFYYRTQLGRAVQRSIQGAVRGLWDDVSGLSLVGYGFAAPFLRPMMAEAERTVCLMPGPQGVCRWPAEGPNVSVLTEETFWPLPAGFADRMIVAHGLESCERPSALLDEIHRVLAPGGRAIFIAPNRSGVWARRDITPFGYGRPYSSGQLERLLVQHDFQVERREAALWGPPSHRRFWLKTNRMWERLGRRIGADRLAGAVIVEATRAWALPRRGTPERARSPLGVLEGLAGTTKPVTGRHQPGRG
ncbi:class I SAM-dependent methyltransferase [Rhodovulum sp. DZ06]|uniref:class I SAM-dependent methyltransferase n=1 Tax=Rhodovulum sp. DZ06 TaxID=3425126 RepID=UPI003D347B16